MICPGGGCLEVLPAFCIRQIFQGKTLQGLGVPSVESPIFTEAFSSHIFMLAIWCNKTYKSSLECISSCKGYVMLGSPWYFLTCLGHAGMIGRSLNLVRNGSVSATPLLCTQQSVQVHPNMNNTEGDTTCASRKGETQPFPYNFAWI